VPDIESITDAIDVAFLSHAEIFNEDDNQLLVINDPRSQDGVDQFSVASDGNRFVAKHDKNLHFTPIEFCTYLEGIRKEAFFRWGQDCNVAVCEINRLEEANGGAESGELQTFYQTVLGAKLHIRDTYAKTAKEKQLHGIAWS